MSISMVLEQAYYEAMSKFNFAVRVVILKCDKAEFKNISKCFLSSKFLT